VLAGPLLAPFIYRDARRHLAWRSVAIGVLIVAGVFALQWGHAQGQLRAGDWLAMAAVVFAAFMYPLGNRMVLLHLEQSGSRIGATQRVFGMTLCSWPLWLVLAVATWIFVGPPSGREVLLAGGVALSSGVIATVLFFRATDMVRTEPTALAAVEAMQAAELLFATIIGATMLGEVWPRGFSAFGAVMIIIGIALFGWMSGRSAAGHEEDVRTLRTDRGA
jgi:drug/metabolite transporter (DMT)-like permease